MPRKPGPKKIGSGKIAEDENQTVTHLHAGTYGRMLRACMNAVRSNPEWSAHGSIETIPHGDGWVYRQKLIRPEQATTDEPD